MQHGRFATFQIGAVILARAVIAPFRWTATAAGSTAQVSPAFATGTIKLEAFARAIHAGITCQTSTKTFSSTGTHTIYTGLHAYFAGRARIGV